MSLETATKISSVCGVNCLPLVNQVFGHAEGVGRRNALECRLFCRLKHTEECFRRGSFGLSDPRALFALLLLALFHRVSRPGRASREHRSIDIHLMNDIADASRNRVDSRPLGDYGVTLSYKF